MNNLMSKRFTFFILSIILIICGVAGALINGFVWDIQFEGGSIIKVEMVDDTFDANQIASDLSSLLKKSVTAQKSATFNPENSEDTIDLLVLKLTKEDTLTDTELDSVFEFLKTEYNIQENAEKSVQNVAPFIGEEMKRSALLAVLIASILIVFYVWYRFSVMSGLSAALFAIVALIHDALIMLSVYTIFQIPINEVFVAAVLTIIGYSMNDTIVIYDRIRENSGSKARGKMDYEGLVNKSISQSLSRSIKTLTTTLICIVTIYILASVNNIQTIKDFTLPLMIGLISGTYSSIFIASPLWMMWRQKKANQIVRK